ncbi:MAG: type III-B CRISPR module RAMP protein Cmr6 [Acidobacteria bacterium]|nr:type III-B CRISPR module RAMP protein Cmr6 [Acidobacteriota bacterium]
MAGGVMENAGLCLDRFSGEPYIPGSAVKGCARRMAIQELLDAPDEQKLELLIKIALTFGWGAQDWKTKEDFKQDWEKERSDFAFALGDRLWNRTFVREIKARLWQEVFGNDFSSENFDRQLGHFAGRGQFLPAHPTATCSLELDVLTCHHQKYYQGEPDFEVAPDTEDPGPVIFFPAVAPGNSFVFAVIAQDDQAVNWLKKGLKWFGIGAKTNAGYGWFLPDEERQQKFAEEADARRRREAVKEMPETEIKQGVNQFSALSDNEIRAKINELRHRTDYSRPEIRILLQTLIGPKRSILENIRSSGTRPDRKRLEALEEAAKVLGVDLS